MPPRPIPDPTAKSRAHPAKMNVVRYPREQILCKPPHHHDLADLVRGVRSRALRVVESDTSAGGLTWPRHTRWTNPRGKGTACWTKQPSSPPRRVLLVRLSALPESVDAWIRGADLGIAPQPWPAIAVPVATHGSRVPAAHTLSGWRARNRADRDGGRQWGLRRPTGTTGTTRRGPKNGQD